VVDQLLFAEFLAHAAAEDSAERWSARCGRITVSHPYFAAPDSALTDGGGGRAHRRRVRAAAGSS
jgi:hypothetical protein